MKFNERIFLNKLCKKLVRELDDIIYVGILDNDKKLLVGNLKYAYNNYLQKSLFNRNKKYLYYSDSDPWTYYYLFVDIESQLDAINLNDYDYLSISSDKEDKFKVIVVPLDLYKDRTYYLCLYLFSNRMTENIVKSVFNLI